MRLLRQMAKEHPIMITVEENGIGGFGSHGRHSTLPASLEKDAFSKESLHAADESLAVTMMAES